MNKIAVVAVLLVIATTGVSAWIDLVAQPASQDLSSNATTASVAQAMSSAAAAQAASTHTLTLSSTTGPARCPSDQASSNNSSRGMTLLLCFKSGAKLGDNVDLHIIFRNDASTSPVYVAIVNMTITDANGNITFHQLGGPSRTVELTQGLSYELYTTWNTGMALNGIVPVTGIHHVHVNVSGFSSDTDISLSV